MSARSCGFTPWPDTAVQRQRRTTAPTWPAWPARAGTHAGMGAAQRRAPGAVRARRRGGSGGASRAPAALADRSWSSPRFVGLDADPARVVLRQGLLHAPARRARQRDAHIGARLRRLHVGGIERGGKRAAPAAARIGAFHAALAARLRLHLRIAHAQRLAAVRARHGAAFARAAGGLGALVRQRWLAHAFPFLSRMRYSARPRWLMRRAARPRRRLSSSSAAS